MQTSVSSGQLAKFTAGKCYSYRGPVADAMPLEDMAFGYAAVRAQDTARAARLPNMNLYVGELSAELVADDVVTFVGKTVTPGGTETAINISVTFASNHDTTAAAIDTAIQSDDSDIVVTRDADNLVFTLTVGADKRLVVTTPLTVTSGGAGTAEFTNTKGSTDKVFAISERDPNSVVALDFTNTTDPTNKKNRMASFVRNGDPAVPIPGTASAGDPAYALLEDYTDSDDVLNPRGSVRPDTDSDLAPVILISDAEFSEASQSNLCPLAIKKA